MDFSLLKENLEQLENQINMKINSKTIGMHNHPPMKGVQLNCVYCKLYGNVFENGPLTNISNDMKDIIFSVCE